MGGPMEHPTGSPITETGLPAPDDREPTSAAELHVMLVPIDPPGGARGVTGGAGRPVLARLRRSGPAAVWVRIAVLPARAAHLLRMVEELMRRRRGNRE